MIVPAHSRRSVRCTDSLRSRPDCSSCGFAHGSVPSTKNRTRLRDFRIATYEPTSIQNTKGVNHWQSRSVHQPALSPASSSSRSAIRFLCLCFMQITAPAAMHVPAHSRRSVRHTNSHPSCPDCSSCDFTPNGFPSKKNEHPSTTSGLKRINKPPFMFTRPPPPHHKTAAPALTTRASPKAARPLFQYPIPSPQTRKKARPLHASLACKLPGKNYASSLTAGGARRSVCNFDHARAR